MSVAIAGDLLLDTNAALAACAAGPAADCVEAALRAGRRVWLSAAAVPELAAAGRSKAVAALAARCQMLAALAGDAALWGHPDPAWRQLEVQLQRLGAGARLLTTDPARVASCPAALLPPDALRIGFAPAAMSFIDVAAQQDRLREPIERRLHEVLRHGVYIMGPEIAELERQLAAYVGVKHAITVASGTDSLEIAMRALGIGPGDEVITVPFTWISTAESIALCGAKPVFVDIEPATFNLDVDRLAAAITPRTKAIMPVSLFGQMPDYERIAAIAAKQGIPVIEDGAQSFGATRHGRRSCGVTLVGSASFFPAKPLGCYGDGGALFSDDDALAAKMRAIRTHGGERRHHHPYLGMNGRLDTLQAAIVLAKLPSYEDEVAARRRIGGRYSDLLRPLCAVPEVAPGNTHVYAQYTVRLAGRDAVAGRMKAVGVPTAVYYPTCLHEQPIFAPLGHRLGDFPESERAAREVLSLPMHPFLSEAEQDRVVAAVRGALAGC